MKDKIIKFLKEWMLPIAMIAGAGSYLIYHSVDAFKVAGPILVLIVKCLQPLLIFSMLFLSLCKVEPRDLKPHRWHWWLLLIQGGLFCLFGVGLTVATQVWGSELAGAKVNWGVLVESVMLCLICPTAGAAAVVTRKLGGDVAGITTYTILINLLTALLVPTIVPLIHPMEGMGFFTAFSMISAKVFPLLIIPCMAAWLVRYLLPQVHKFLLKFSDLAFYLWAVALALAIAMTTKFLAHSVMPILDLLLIAAVSLVCCAFQFWTGKKIGSMYGRRAGKESKKITAGQAMGQKNTVLAIWMAYTFMTPETAIVGGMYSIWHNIYNSYQLRKHNQ
jgi:BASS family bile acid:Na+ symporter